MTRPDISIVLPVSNQASFITQTVEGYREALEVLPMSREILLVENGSTDATPEACAALAQAYDDVRLVTSPRGWGSAVRTGLRASAGELLCYANSARTAPADLVRIVEAAGSRPDAAVKAHRIVRESWKRRLGSAIYNLECRLLFGFPWRDVNGTPKAFPRRFEALLRLTRDDDVIDAEFLAICRRFGYPLVEVPIRSTRRHGGRSTTGLRSAWRMYLGALALRRALPRPARRRAAAQR